MIVKTIRWKVPQFERLVQYVSRDRDHNQSFSVFHNLWPEGLAKISQQFRENDRYRKPRKNGVIAYHEILSMARGDRRHVSAAILEDLTRKYLQLRAPNGIGFAMPHFDREHVHVHVVLSGTEFRSAKTLRMDNRTFTKLRRDIEAYQVQRYPELRNSVVHIDKPVVNRALRREITRQREVVEAAFREASGLEDFLDRVVARGMDVSTLDPEVRVNFEVDIERLARMDERQARLPGVGRIEVPRRPGGLR